MGELLEPARLRQELSSACLLLRTESLAHSAENRCLRYINEALTKLIFPHFGIMELTILSEGDDDMLTKYTPKNREQVEMITLDQLVPENHLVRKVEAAIDFSFIYPLVEEAYSAERVRPSIDPVVLIHQDLHPIHVRHSFHA